MKVEKSVSMHLRAFERPCKRQVVTDPKSRNASHISLLARIKFNPRYWNAFG